MEWAQKRQECNNGAFFRKCLFPFLVKPGAGRRGEGEARVRMYFLRKKNARGVPIPYDMEEWERRVTEERAKEKMIPVFKRWM